MPVSPESLWLSGTGDLSEASILGNSHSHWTRLAGDGGRWQVMRLLHSLSHTHVLDSSLSFPALSLQVRGATSTVPICLVLVELKT